MGERVNRRWSVGPYEFVEVEFRGAHPFTGRTLYRYTIDGEQVDAELYASLDRVMVAAVGARHMGPRGAGGNAVGTAADWFCVMVGITEDEHAEEPDGSAPAPERCVGSNRGWMVSTNSPEPACRQCGATWSELGVSRPVSIRGLVPPHVEK